MTMDILGMSEDHYKMALSLGHDISRYADLVQGGEVDEEITKKDHAVYAAAILSIFSIYGRHSINPMPRILHTLALALSEMKEE